MHIEKLAHRTDAFRRHWLPYRDARSAFKAFLQGLCFASDELVLLPAFIGWSAREGSGVFDPVAELGLPHRFYRMDGRLTIDLEHLRQLFRTHNVKALVIIHYFGYVDPGYPEAVAMAREFGVCVLEDEAHAMFTDLVGGISGRLGDAAIFSLHKLLPVPDGGMLVLNRESCLRNCEFPLREEKGILLPWEFDLQAIARKRIENAKYLASLLESFPDEVEPLRKSLVPGEVPQTFPVFIHCASRDKIYQVMNDAGYGVVTLYHTMISQISRDEFPEAHSVARCILNLPMHQDVERSELAAMIEKLLESVRILAG